MTQPTPTLDYAYDPRPRHARSLIGWVLFIGLAIMLFLLLKNNRGATLPLALSDFKIELLSGNVREVTISPDELAGTFKRPRTIGGMTAFRVTLPQGMGAQWSFTQWVLDNNVGAATVNADNGSNVVMQVLLPMIPWLLVFLFIWFFVFRHLRRTAPVQVLPTQPNERSA
jgi:ATP-dependent Zn protease